MERGAARGILQGASGLSERDGIFFSAVEAQVSYPEEGSERSRDLESDSFWFAHRNECIVALIRRHPPLERTVFDVGGGNGYVSEGLREAGFEAVVVEPLRLGALGAKERGIPLVVCSALREAGFPPGSIPAVGLFDVLEHVEDEIAFLGEVHRALVPGGRVYLTVPAHRWLWSVYDEIAGHYRRYTSGGLERTLAAAGFECEFRSYFFWFLPLPVLLTRTLPWRAGLLRHGVEHRRSQREHRVGGGVTRRAVARLCAREARRLRAGKGPRFGASCLMAARKP